MCNRTNSIERILLLLVESGLFYALYLVSSLLLIRGLHNDIDIYDTKMVSLIGSMVKVHALSRTLSDITASLLVHISVSN